ncbi:MAG: hypothetical protein ACFE95_22315, partial [Candidatus Hodarchaeota archaeon]
MRLSRWKNTQQHYWIGALIIFFLILGSLLTQLAIILPFNHSLQNNNAPRLMGTISQISDTGSDSDSDFTQISQGNHFTSNFAIGQQAGTGGGSYNVYDSFNWTGTEL